MAEHTPGGRKISTAAIVAAMEDEFRRYLTACEYLQIDPAKAYDIRFIRERSELVISQWGPSDDPRSVKKLQKILKWFVKHYDYLTRGGMLGQIFAERSADLVKKGKLNIQFGTVNDNYFKKELRQDNYDGYAKAQNRIAWFAVAATVLIIGTVIVLMMIFD